MYTQRYGLYQKPFENTPDPQFLFLSKSHREVLSSLVYGIESAKGFIIVSGDIGTGKTTLIYAFLKEIEPSNVVLHIVNPKINFDQISFTLAQKLNINPDGINSIDLISAIKEKLIELDKQEKRAIIIIDEAHLLSEKSLEDVRILSNIETEKRKLIQIVIVGQNEIHHKLNKESQKALKQRIVLNRKLTPLSKKDCFEYISHRLKIAGTESKIFSKAALNKIWGKSRGIPRLINQICDNALLIGFALDKNTIDCKIIKEVIKDMESDKELISRDKKPNQWITPLFLSLISISIICIFLIILFPQSISKITPSREVVHSLKPEETFDHDIAAESPAKKTKDESQKLKDSKLTTPPVLKNNPINKIHKKIEIQPVANLKNDFDLEFKKESGNQTTIKPNDYLMQIAKKEYGVANDTIIDLIHMANPQIKNVNKIFLGQKIFLPLIEKDDFIVKNGNGSFHIHYASFYSQDKAKKDTDKLNKENKVVFTIPVRHGENLVYRVYIGIFNDKDTAKNHLKAIRFVHLPFL